MSSINEINFPLYVTSDEGILYLAESALLLEKYCKDCEFRMYNTAYYDSLYRRVKINEKLLDNLGKFALSIDNSVIPEESVRQLWQFCANACEANFDYEESQIGDKDLPTLIEILRSNNRVKRLQETTPPPTLREMFRSLFQKLSKSKQPSH